MGIVVNLPDIFSVSVPAKGASRPELERTLDSLFAQTAVVAGRAGLQVFVITPDMTDEELLYFNSRYGSEINSLRDSGEGMYAALASSFHRHLGTWNCYLGVGDALEESAFDIVLEISQESSHRGAKWITGLIATRRADGAIVRVTNPPRYLRRGLREGWYSRALPSIQQESTLWHASLHEKIDLSAFSRFKLAGDYFLWRTFSEFADVTIVEAIIGTFRWHGDNMSQDWDSYLKEIEALCGRLTLRARTLAKLEQVCWAIPSRWQHRLFGRHKIRYAWPVGPWQ